MISTHRFMWRTLKEAGIEPKNIIGARSSRGDGHHVPGRHGVAVLFDHFVASGLAEGRIVKLGPPMPAPRWCC